MGGGGGGDTGESLWDSVRCPLPAHQRFLDLEGTVTALSEGCASVFARLEGTQTRTSNFLVRTEELREQRASVEARQSTVNDFLQRFQLSDAEMKVRAPCRPVCGPHRGVRNTPTTVHDVFHSC